MKIDGIALKKGLRHQGQTYKDLSTEAGIA